jgi:hypothetical protein
MLSCSFHHVRPRIALQSEPSGLPVRRGALMKDFASASLSGLFLPAFLSHHPEPNVFIAQVHRSTEPIADEQIGWHAVVE